MSNAEFLYKDLTREQTLLDVYIATLIVFILLCINAWLPEQPSIETQQPSIETQPSMETILRDLDYISNQIVAEYGGYCAPSYLKPTIKRKE